MQANQLPLFEFLNSTKKIITSKNHRIFNCDIEFAINFYNSIKNNDFLGIFTLQKTDKEDEYILIDGYSRLLLFSLLISAIYNNNLDYEDFIQQLNEKNQKELKLHFLNLDQDFYKAISTNYYENLDKCPKILSEIYNIFLQKTASNKKKTSKLIKNILNIQAIFLISDEKEISQTKLYEGLNKFSNSLSEYDLIKNYVFEICEEKNQTHLFNNYFLQIEKEYSEQNIQNYFIDFIKDYLTIQNNGKIPQKGNLYYNFKEFINKISILRDLETTLKDFYRYSKYYAKIITENISDEEILSEIQIINNECAFDAYPYLMEVFEDWDKNIINKNMLIDILKMVNMFIEQRKSPNASKFVMTFAKLSTQINKMLALKDYTPKITEEIITINKLMQE